MTRRKTLAILFTVVMVLLAGCGSAADGSGNPVESDTNASNAPNDTQGQNGDSTNDTTTTTSSGTQQDTSDSQSGSSVLSGSSDGSSGDTGSSSESETNSNDSNDSNESNDTNQQQNQSNESKSGGTVTLTLEDHNEEPITRGTVSITLPGADIDFERLELQPDENGQVTFEAPVDENYYYGVTGQGINYDNNNGQINVNGDTQETIQVIETTHTLSVQANSSVTIERASDGATTSREPTDGTVEFTVLPGEYTISADGYENKNVDVQNDKTVSLTPTQTNGSGPPTETNQSVTIGAKNPDGVGLESTITLTGPDGQTYSSATGANGEATFTVPSGEYDYEITVTENQSREYEMANMDYSDTIEVSQSTSDTHEFTIYPEPRSIDVSMQVVNAETGEAIEGAQIKGISPNMANPYKPDFSKTTGSNGYYEGTVPNVENSGYDYVVSADGYESIDGKATHHQLDGKTFSLQPTEETESSQQTNSQDNSSETSSQSNDSESTGETSSQATEETESSSQANASEINTSENRQV